MAFTNLPLKFTSKLVKFFTGKKTIKAQPYARDTNLKIRIQYIRPIMNLNCGISYRKRKIFNLIYEKSETFENI